MCLPLAMGCGMVAAPQPPSLKLPEPVTNLKAQRIGNQVDLSWTMPKRTTDNVLLEGGQRAEICRQVAAGPCANVGRIIVAPQTEATFTDTLAPALLSGAPSPLTYVVELENHAGRSAGPSNKALTASGPAPAKIVDLQARAQPNGIELSWSPAAGEGTVRIHRVTTNVDGQKIATSKVPTEQTLEFSGKDEGRVLDADAALDHIYTYRVQRVAKIMLDGRSVEVDGAPSEAVTINARDVFPPAVPQGLQAVADAEAKAIDLSWEPDTESDLAGYVVYRRESEADEVVKLAKVAAPSYRDATAEPGHTYCYSVSAVDQDGNESARSAEAQEGLPSQ